MQTEKGLPGLAVLFFGAFLCNRNEVSCYTKKTPEIPMSIRRRDRIRTCDFYVPNVALYQAEPHAADRYANTEQEKFQLVFEKIHNIFYKKC